MICKDCLHYEVCKEYIETALDGLDYSKLNMVADDCNLFIDRSRFVELPDDFPKRRLTTDKPMGNFETMMNFAYAKGDNVVLRYGARKCDIDLCEYMETVANCQFIGLEAEDYMEGACFECDSNCPFGILYTVAVQAAELRERLKMYEDLAEQVLKERKENPGG